MANWEGLDEAFAELEAECANVIRGMTVEIFKYTLQQSPQSKGVFVSSWQYSLNRPIYWSNPEFANVEPETYMKGNLALSLESNEVRMSQLARNEMTYGRYFDFSEIVGMIDALTMDDYMRVCERIFRDKQFSLVSVGKLKKKGSTIPDLTI